MPFGGPSAASTEKYVDRMAFSPVFVIEAYLGLRSAATPADAVIRGGP
jgi:hypothetical protein